MKTVLYLLPFLSFGAYAQQPSAILHDDWTGINWLQSSGTDYYYNGNDMETSAISKLYYDGTATWIDDERVTSYYSPSGNQITYRYFAQGIDTFPDTTRRTVFAYNTYGQLIEETSQYYFPTYWQNGFRTVYSYSSNTGNVQTSQYEWWDSDLGQWTPLSKNVYTYNSNQTQSVYYVWDNSQWNTEGRTTTMFNQNNEREEELNESWSGSVWEPGSKSTYTYTNFGKISDAVMTYYSPTENGYIPGDSVHYIYNSDQSIDAILVMNFDNQADIWSNLRRDRYVYNSHLTLAEQTETTLLAFPNPAINSISITADQSGSVKIIDTQGKIWKSSIDINGEAVDISDLPQGMYFIQLQTADELVTKPFVKQ